jgi:hypothetical protein
MTTYEAKQIALRAIAEQASQAVDNYHRAKMSRSPAAAGYKAEWDKLLEAAKVLSQ